MPKLGYFYTDQLRTRINAGASLNNKVLKLTLMARAPQLDDDDARPSLRGVTTVASLTAQDGWEEVASVNYVPQNTTTPLITVGNNNYVKLNSSLVAFPANMGRTPVEALVISVNGTDIGLSAGDKVIFGTTTPFLENVTFQGGDGISARLDTSIGHRWLFGYALNAGTVTSIVEGTTVIQQGSPPYELSHVSHSWLLPQRINYAANPSWEAGTTHWQTTAGAMSRTVAADDFPSHWLGHVTGSAPAAVLPQYTPGDRLYLKSNSFFPRQQDFTFQMMLRGQGIARVGLSYWPRDYSENAVDWGLRESMIFEEWVLSPTTFTHVHGVRRMSDGYEASLVIEVRTDDKVTHPTPDLYTDLVLVEEGILLQWSYFDGDSTYGGPDDYSWYGDVPFASKRGKSFSLWYNNRRSIAGRLFGRRLDDTAYYTSDDEQLDSLVSQWTPAGAVVFPHLDVLDVDDLQTLPTDRSATALTRTVWPEQVQPFRILNITGFSNTGMTVQVVGEGAFPVSGGYIQSNSTTTAITIAPRVYNPADLYDQSKPQTIVLSWPNLPAFNTNTLYLERGNAASPQSWLSLDLHNYIGTANFAVATGIAYATVPSVKPVLTLITATGVGFDAVVLGGFGNVQVALASGTADSPGIDGSTGSGAAVSTGVGNNASVRYDLGQVTAASGTGLANDAGVNISAKPGTATASGTGTDLGAGTLVWDGSSWDQGTWA